MWIKNLKSFARHLINNKLYTLVTIIGFAISLTFVILLSVYLKNEMSVNSKQKNKDRIYRLRSEDYSGFAPPIASWLQSDIPEIESTTRVFTNTSLIKVPNNNEMLKFKSLLVDSTFFTIFNIDLLEGEKETVLKTKNSIVLSKEYARKYFGKESPIGKQITINDRIHCTISGVFDNLSRDTHFKDFDGLVNFRLLADIWDYPQVLTTNNNCSFDLYLLEKPNSNLPSKAPQILKMFKKNFWIYRDERVKEVIFEPLSDVYFSKVSGQGINQNSKTLVSVLTIIVFLILFLSIINYMNLTIAQSSVRVKSIAIRKLLGATRNSLNIQYVVESVILVLISFVIALVLSFISEYTFNSLLQTKLNLSDTISTNSILLVLAFIIIIGFVSGIIPALVITKLKAVDVIKGGFRRKNKALYSRLLIGFQYIVVIVLIISTLVIGKQANFMMSKDLGFNKENIIELPNYLDANQFRSFKHELLNNKGIKNVSYVSGNPIDGGNNNSFVYKGKPMSMQVFKVDSAFFKMTGIKIQPTGVAYSKDGIWLNQTAIKEFELGDSPTAVTIQKETRPILGILDDFNFKDLTQKIGMLSIEQMDSSSYPWSILVQIDGQNIPQTIEGMKNVYKKFVPGITIDYTFFDDEIASWYEKEERMSTIIKYFSILAIIISVMGIYAMSVFYNQQKIKEIGVRKVNGATIIEIINMLNKEFSKWVFLAFVIAVPIGYYLMNKWLEQFAYRINLSWWIFALAGLLALVVALLTISWNTFSAARRNPVEALRYE